MTRREGGKGRKTWGRREERETRESDRHRDMQRAGKQEKRGEGVKAYVPGLSGM